MMQLSTIEEVREALGLDAGVPIDASGAANYFPSGCCFFVIRASESFWHVTVYRRATTRPLYGASDVLPWYTRP